MKTLFFKSPEYYFIILSILAGYSPPFFINPIFIGIIGLLILQIMSKNRIAGIILGSILLLLNLYFLGALLSEFHEFTEINGSAMQLLIVGSSIWIVNLIFSTTMIYKYSVNYFEKSSQIKFN